MIGAWGRTGRGSNPRRASRAPASAAIASSRSSATAAVSRSLLSAGGNAHVPQAQLRLDNLSNGMKGSFWRWRGSGSRRRGRVQPGAQHLFQALFKAGSILSRPGIAIGAKRGFHRCRQSSMEPRPFSVRRDDESRRRPARHAPERWRRSSTLQETSATASRRYLPGLNCTNRAQPDARVDFILRHDEGLRPEAFDNRANIGPDAGAGE